MAEALFYALVLGVFIGAIYDFLRLLRLVFSSRFFIDFFFWIICAFAVFSYLLIYSSGELRAIYFVFILIGFILYMFTLGSVTKRWEMNLAKKIKNRLKKIKNKIKNKLKKFKKVLQSTKNLYYNRKIRKSKKTEEAEVESNAADEEQEWQQ